jgi:hypothetical protein
MRTRNMARHVLPLLITALLAPACARTPAGPDPESGSAAPTTVTGGPETSAPPALTAADGADVTACTDADCEILVDAAAGIPLDPTFGCRRFIVTYVTPNQVTFEVGRSELSDVNASIKGTGYLSLGNGVTVTVEKIDDSGAVLRFSPTAQDTKNDKGSGSEGFSIYST